MTVPTRGARPRRSGRRPGWLLLTVLLVLAIVASSALVFTNRVELLKLAVILALWAAVVAAFVSVIYRRQSDVDQAKARDLKLVYDLQLDREISARREYELTVETQLRRELVSELRAAGRRRGGRAARRAGRAAGQSGDPVRHRPESSAGDRDRADREPDSARAGWPAAGSTPTGRRNLRTEENPIIDVPAEPHAPEHEWIAHTDYSAVRIAGHRRPSRLRRSASSGRRSSVQPNTVPPRNEPRPSSVQPPSSAWRSNGPRPSSGGRTRATSSAEQPATGDAGGGSRCRRGRGRGAAESAAATSVAERARDEAQAVADAPSRTDCATRRGSPPRPEAVDPGRNARQQLGVTGRGERLVGASTSAGVALPSPRCRAAAEPRLAGVTPRRPTRPIRTPRRRTAPTLAPPPQPGRTPRPGGGRTAPSQCRRGRRVRRPAHRRTVGRRVAGPAAGGSTGGGRRRRRDE